MAGIPTRVAFNLALTRLTLALEYAAGVLWAPLSIVCGFVLLAALDVLPSLPNWLHATIVVLFAVALAASLRRGFIKNALPARADFMRRVEQDSHLHHRPLDTLSDKPAGRRDLAAELWALHQARAAGQVSRLRAKWPRASLTAHDSRAWRALAALALVVGLVIGSDHLADRLDAALSPHMLGAVAARDIGVEAWITPPEYTGLPPIILARTSDAQQEAIEVPEGSVVEAHVTGGKARPHIVMNGVRQKFQRTDPTNFQVSAGLHSSGEITITKGWHTLVRWQVNVLDTTAPAIAWVHPPSADKAAAVKLDYTAADQYGLAKLKATIELADEVRATMLPKGSALDRPDAGSFTVALSDVSGHPKSLKSTSSEDWTANPWAGFPVRVTLSATSISGVSASTDPKPLVLPERIFTDPVAHAIVAERKKLILDPATQRIGVATKISELAGHTELYHDDVTVFLVLRTAASRLWKDAALEQVRDIEDMLWKTAIRLEDGQKGEAAKSVADAEKALRQALDNGAPQSEIDRLTKSLKQAMNDYMNQLQKDLQQRLARGEKIPMIPPGMDGKTLSRKSLDDMADKMNSLSQSGNRDAAKDMLSQLENTMRNLRMAEQMKPNSKSMQAWNAMQQMRGLAERQQKLMDKTFRRSRGESTQQDEMQSMDRDMSDPTKRQHGQAGDNGEGEQQTLKETLQGLQQQLKQLGAKMPSELKQSEEAMGSAKGRLGQNDFSHALPSQQEALDKLRQGLKALSDQMNKEGSGLMLGNGDPEGPGQQEGKNDDPFGRSDDNNGRSADDQRVHVPDESEQQRSREILEELRKRSGERFRSHEEHDYINRLLKDY